MKQENNSMLRLGGILCAFTLIIALLLASVNALTADVIKQNEVNKLNTALTKVFPDAVQFPEAAVADADKADRGIVSAYMATDAGGKVLGMAVNVAPNGFGGPINMIVGVDADGKVVQAEILSLAETPGLGTKAKEPKFIDQYANKSGNLSVIKSGKPGNNEILAITGATISSRAVTTGVNNAIAYAAAHINQ
jgi:electron transport complex protein RnfG